MKKKIIYAVRELDIYHIGLDELPVLLSRLLDSNLLKLGDAENEVQLVYPDDFNAETADPAAPIIHVDFSILLELSKNFFSYDADEIQTEILLDLASSKIIATHKIFNQYLDVCDNSEDFKDLIIEAVVHYNYTSGSENLTVDKISSVRILRGLKPSGVIYKTLFAFNPIDDFCADIEEVMGSLVAEGHIENTLHGVACKFVEDNINTLTEHLKTTHCVKAEGSA